MQIILLQMVNALQNINKKPEIKSYIEMSIDLNYV